MKTESLETQVQSLATFIQENCEGYPNANEGAIDCAITIITDLQAHKDNEVVSFPAHKIGDRLWIMDHDKKLSHRTINKIKTIHVKDEDPRIGYYFNNNGYIIEYISENKLFKTREELADSL